MKKVTKDLADERQGHMDLEGQVKNMTMDRVNLEFRVKFLEYLIGSAFMPFFQETFP